MKLIIARTRPIGEKINYQKYIKFTKPSKKMVYMLLDMTLVLF